MAAHRVLNRQGWRSAAQLASTALGVALGTSLATSCSGADDVCDGDPGSIQLGSFTLTTAEAEGAELNALLDGPDPVTLSVGVDRIRLEYRRDGVPVHVVYDVVSKYE